ncbi:hypothetical protein TNCV_3372351 [Trichonephila clavipes]|nr:hypothetical protein TNCV_3372351 [Trichonephila clavipes]
MITADSRVIIDEVASFLNTSYGLANQIIYDELKFLNVYARCVSRMLSAAIKNKRLDIYQSLLYHFSAEGDVFLSRIELVIIHKTWVQHYEQRIEVPEYGKELLRIA